MIVIVMNLVIVMMVLLAVVILVGIVIGDDNVDIGDSVTGLLLLEMLAVVVLVWSMPVGNGGIGDDGADVGGSLVGLVVITHVVMSMMLVLLIA